MRTLPRPPEAAAPVRTGRLQHLPALDGLRGLAVLAVLLFHGGFGWAKGGWLGVSVFFTLSGFLITNLLVAEWGDTRSISLKTFWSRRFRRLMPAAVATLLLVALYGWAYASPEQLRNLRGDLFAGLAYAANWRFLLADLSYADLFSAPSPVQHFWSLAIEEQFYVVYPLVAFGALKLGGRRLLGGLLVVATAASLAVAYLVRGDLDRVYYGTDTRMAELLAGGLLALWWSARPLAQQEGRTAARRWGVVALGAFGLAGSLLLWPTVSQTSDRVTEGILPLQAVLSVAVIAAGARPGLVSRALAWKGFTALGLVSYGLYLFHWPVFLVLSEERVELSIVPLFALRMSVTAVLALASYHLLEQPIRRRRVLVRPVHVGAAVVGGLAAVVVATIAVTWSPPRTQIAHADVSLDDQTITVQTLPPTQTTVPVTAEVPATVMVIGDSGTFDAAPAIAAQFQRFGTGTVIDASFPGFGLTVDPAGWRERWPQIVAEQDPRLIVVMLGGWDAGFVDEQGEAAYDALLDEAVGVLTSRGATILWLAMLPGDVSAVDADTMNPIYQRLAQRHPGVVGFGSVGSALATPVGTFPRWLPGEDGELELVRKPDGWHLCPAGAIRVAREVTKRTAELGWSPPPDAGWYDGEWRTNERYDDPKGGCDTSSPDNAPLPG